MRFHNIIAINPAELKGQIVSLIGGGGKTSLALQVGRELAEEGLKVIVTTTTKIEAVPGVPLILASDNLFYEQQLHSCLNGSRLVMLADRPYRGDKLVGLPQHFVPALLRYADVVFVEADGARQRSLKVHKTDEPVIPARSTIVVILCGADVVNRQLQDRFVHRAALFADKWRLEEGAKLTSEIIARELLSPAGYLRNIPLRAKIVFFVSKTDTNPHGGEQLASTLWKRSDWPVFFGSLKRKSLTKAL